VLIALAFLALQGAKRRQLTERAGAGRLPGAWVVEQLTVDGVPQTISPEAVSWRRLALDRGRAGVQRAGVQLAGGGWQRYYWHLAGSTLELGERVDAAPAASLVVQRAGADRLDLAGDVEGHQVHAVLAREERRFRLLDRDIHWLREGPAQ